MSKKIFFTLLIFLLFIIAICSYSFAADNIVNGARNAVMDTENMVGNVATGVKDGVSSVTSGLTNGANKLGQKTEDATKDLGNDTRNTKDSAVSTLNTKNSDYDATRTATTTSNFLGLTNNVWTWLILGIIGIVIVALVWYYGAKYEHRNYNND